MYPSASAGKHCRCRSLRSESARRSAGERTTTAPGPACSMMARVSCLCSVDPPGQASWSTERTTSARCRGSSSVGGTAPVCSAGGGGWGLTWRVRALRPVAASCGRSAAGGTGPRVRRLFADGAAVGAYGGATGPVQEGARTAGASEAIVTPGGTQGAVLQYAGRGAADWAGRSLQRGRESRPARRTVRAEFVAATRPSLKLGRVAVETDRAAVGGVPSSV